MQEPEIRQWTVTVSARAAQQLTEHAAFAARLEERLALRLTAAFREAAASLRMFPYRNPVLRAEFFPSDKYRKMVFAGHYLLIYQIKVDTVRIEYVVDGRQDYGWLLT